MPPTASEAVGRVLNSGAVSGGPAVRDFEKKLSEYLGTPYVLALSDISAALQLGLFLAGVRPNTEVLAPPMLCVASSMPIANLWARPRWADVEASTGMLDAGRLKERFTPQCKAVLYYHWSGDVADGAAIDTVAKSHGLKTVEDASDAFGAERNGKRIGSGTADFTAFSFRATKHINSGEGAALVCRDANDYEQARWLRRYGIHEPSFRSANGDLNPRSDIPVAGWNIPMTNFCAAIGMEQWPHVEGLVQRYRENGRFYDEALKGIPGVTLTARLASSVGAYWTYSLLVERREAFVQKLIEAGIGTQRLHVRNDTYSCFAEANRPALPGTDHFDARTVSIPCGYWVSDKDREEIVACIRRGW